MVFAFVITTLQPGFVKLLYSTTFDRDDSLTDRQDRKEVLQRVCQKVASEYDAMKRYTNRNDAGDFERLRSDNVLPEFSRGIVRLEPEEFFADGKMILWFAAIDTGFALILENSENVHVATLNLKLLIQNLQQYTQVMTEPVVALARVERIVMVVERSIPNGVLPLHTSALLKERLKETDKSFSRLIKEKG
ncbi:hypothetical protein BV898_03970 [Hypsibius exemplaris]|uniref:AP-5 complex subunit sigma-1 n=1 Tax=Hypsibius exemplaris TaxID=2072580 RepID=A0A1W0X472_HYPEX|nr:hypothetical protein BV898_03970 [Hypsibius exemplaris]